MIKKQVWQYRCEFCGKRGLSSGHMRRHETGCTLNPARVCKFHANFDEPQRPILELRAALDIKLPDAGLATLRTLAENCPMCILSAIRQSQLFKWDGDPENPAPSIDFDFKAELKSAWDTINYAKAEERQDYYG